MEPVGHKEINAALSSGRPSAKLRAWDGDGTLKATLPCVHALHGLGQDLRWHKEGDVFEHTLKAVDIYRGPVEGRWALLFHDTGKKSTHTKVKGRDKYPEHAKVSVKLAKEKLKELGMPAAERDRALWLIKHHDFYKLQAWDFEKVKKLVANPLFKTLMRVAYADEKSHGVGTNSWEETVHYLKVFARFGQIPKERLAGADRIKKVPDSISGMRKDQGAPKPLALAPGTAGEGHPDWLYHATNEERASDVAAGGLKIHRPWEHTDQRTWPDGSVERRNYFTHKPASAWQFAPEEGRPVLLRVRRDAHPFLRESTGDFYSTKPVHPAKVDMLSDKGNWHVARDFYPPEMGKAQEGAAMLPDSGARARFLLERGGKGLVKEFLAGRLAPEVVGRAAHV